MKNTKELKAILSSIFCINHTGCKDNDINNIVEYAVGRILDGNTNMLVLGCVGRTKEEIMPEIMQILKEDTKYLDYLTRKKPLKFKPKTIYTVLVDWVNEYGDKGIKSHLFSTLDKAKKYLREEALSEIKVHHGEEIYIEKGSIESFVESLLSESNADCNLVEGEEYADFVIDASPICFSCYKQGEYGYDHFDLKIIEQAIDEIQTEGDKNE